MAALGTVPPVERAAVPPSGKTATPTRRKGTPTIASVPAVAESEPVTLALPALGVSAQVARIAPVGGVLLPPRDVHQVGWDTDTPVPGSGSGTSLLTGHVDSATDGPGALWQLGQSRPGQQLLVKTSTGRVLTYRIAAVREYPKDAVPADVFATTGTPRLVVVTCGGRFSRGHYQDNLVVYAVPTTAIRPAETPAR